MIFRLIIPGMTGYHRGDLEVQTLFLFFLIQGKWNCRTVARKRGSHSKVRALCLGCFALLTWSLCSAVLLGNTTLCTLKISSCILWFQYKKSFQCELQFSSLMLLIFFGILNCCKLCAGIWINKWKTGIKAYEYLSPMPECMQPSGSFCPGWNFTCWI